MGFRFEYGSPKKESDPSSRRQITRRRRRRPRRRRRFPNDSHRLPRWGKVAILIALVLVASTVITSRDRGPHRIDIEQIATSSPIAESNEATTTTTTSVPVGPEPPARSTASPIAPAQTPLSTATPSAASLSAVDWANLALSVVYIEAGECPSFPADLYSSGSGTVVLDGTHVLTNAHVVLDDNGRPCQVLLVWFTRSFEEKPSEWVRADLLAADKDLDLALLRLYESAPVDRGIEVAAQRMEPGEAVRILGYPDAGGLTMTLTRGAYSGMIDHGSQTYIKTDAALSEGNSGGAAFDEAGVFIGIPTAGIDKVGLLIPAGVAERFLVKALKS